MALQHILINDIDEQQLLRLIDGKVPEARDIEYKRESYGDGDSDRAEWLADISSFANTAGGDIIIGMEARAGVPTRLAPVTINLDQEILRLEQIARSNLQPRIPNLAFRRVSVADGELLIIRTTRSYNAPHRIVRNGKGQNRFWARSSAGKYEPNVDELRALFNLTPQLADRIRDFRADRLAKIAAELTPVKLMDRMCLVLHVVPYSTLDPAGALISLPDVDQHPQPFAPIGSRSASNWWVNFDGIVIPSNANREAPTQRAYTQVYRSGRIEAVASSIAPGDDQSGKAGRFSSIGVEGKILSSLVRYLKGLQALGVEAPYAVMVSLIGTRGAHINIGIQGTWVEDEYSALIEDQYHFAEVILERVPMSIQECGVMLRPFVEQLANAAGRAASPSFGPNGEYVNTFQ